jgi:iron complex outermembrane receptor protein
VGRVFDRPAFAGASFQRNTSVYGIPEAPGLEEEGEEEPALFPGPFIDLASNRWEAKAGIREVGPFQEVRTAVAVVNYGHTEVEPSGEPGTVFANTGVNARFELAHRPVNGLTGLAGLEVQTSDFSALGEEAFLAPTQTRDFAGFIIERFERGPFGLEGGLRYSRVTVDNDTAAVERSFDLISGSLGVSYRPGEHWFLGLTGARTERAPTQVELFSFGPHLATASFDVGDPTLREERLWSLEGTARYTRDRVRLEVNTFANFFDGFIAFTPTGAVEDGLPEFVYVQQDARFIGAEVTGAYDWVRRPGLRISTDASVDLVRAFFEGGGALPRIPPLSTRVGLEAERGLFGLRLEWEHANTQDRVPAFESITEGYDLFNARLDFKPFKNSPVRFFIDGRNLGDEEARVATSFVRDLLPRPGRTVRFAAVLDF